MKVVIFLVFVLVFFLMATVTYIVTSQRGLVWTTDVVLSHLIDAQQKSIGSIRGTLSSSIELKNIELENIKGLPPGILRIQQLIIFPHGLNYQNASIEVFNARLVLPYSDNIVVSGVYHNDTFAFSVFSPSLEVAEILRTIGLKNMHIKGGVDNIDCQVYGTFSRMQVKGSFNIQKLSKDDFTLKQAPGSVDLEILNNKGKDLELNGKVEIEKGQFKSRKTNITLKNSSVYFTHNPKNPSLAIEGYSRIEDIYVDISLKGTKEKPNLVLSSDPPIPSEILMVMLATGRKWQGLEELEQGQLSPDLIKDFVGYLFFSGSGESFLTKMGISQVKVNLQNGQREIGFKKAINNRLNFGYDLQQKTLGTTQPVSIYQTLGADFRVSHRLFVSIEREYPIGNTTSSNEDIDNRILLKYKKAF